MFKKIKEKCKNLLILGRYNNPAGAFLLMWPCYWGVLSYANKSNIFFDLLYFSLGAFIMRGAGCCLNDIFDKDFDSKVKRTKNRPLASGKIGLNEAIIFVILQLILGLLIVLQFEKIVIIWSFFIIVQDINFIPKNTSIGLISLVIYLAIFASIGTIVCLNFASSRLPGTNVMAYSLLIPFWVLMVESTTKDSLAPSYTYIGIIPIGLGLLMLYRNS